MYVVNMAVNYAEFRFYTKAANYRRQLVLATQEKYVSKYAMNVYNSIYY